MDDQEKVRLPWLLLHSNGFLQEYDIQLEVLASFLGKPFFLGMEVHE